jgi:hypothetical protein
MATWHIEKTRKGTLQLIYRDLKQGTFFDCGETSGDTPIRMIQEWILNHCNPFDLIFVGTSSAVPILPPDRGMA